MAGRGQEESRSTRGSAKRQERAHRILDAAASLILRWGYNKTTIDDIARQAGVAKGTIYLHWKSRDELFMALLRREQLAMGRDFLEQITQDPEGATLRGIYKHTALALMKRPLLKGLLLGDKDVVGRLAEREQGSAAYAEKLTGFEVYLEFLRDRGLVRTDLKPRAQLQMASAIMVGFFFLPTLMPDEYRLSDEETAGLIGESVQRALESGRAVSPEEMRSLSHTFRQYLDRVWSRLEEQWREELGP